MKALLRASLLLAILWLGWLVWRQPSSVVPVPQEVAAKPLPEASFLVRPPEGERRVEVEAVQPTPAASSSVPADLPAGRIGGVVLTPDGQPVVGVNIMAKPLWSFGYGGRRQTLMQAVVRTVTNSAGEFAMSLPRQSYFDAYTFLSVANKERTRTYAQGEFLVHDQHLIVVPAEADWQLEGCIRDGAGLMHPLDIFLCAHSPADVGDFGSHLFLVSKGRTDATGRFSLTGIVDPIQTLRGAVKLFVTSKEGDPVAYFDYPTVEALKQAVVPELVLQLTTLVVPITLPGDISSVSEWSLSFPDSSPFLPGPRWHAAGRPPVVQTTVAASSFGVKARTGNEPEMLHGRIDQRQITWLRRTPGRFALEVIARAPSGEPSPRTYVTCKALEGVPGAGSVESAVTDELGKAFFSCEAGPHLVELRGPLTGLAGTTRVSRAVTVPCPELDLQAQPSAVVSVDASFDPPVNKRSQIIVALQRDGESVWRSEILGYPNSANFIDGLPVGRYRLLAFSGGYHSDVLVNIVRPEPLRVALHLVPAQEITGRVLDSARTPIVGARLRAHGVAFPDVPWTKCVTDSTGSFRLWLCPGSRDVEVSAQGYVSQIQPAAASLDIVLVRAGR